MDGWTDGPVFATEVLQNFPTPLQKYVHKETQSEREIQHHRLRSLLVVCSTSSTRGEAGGCCSPVRSCPGKQLIRRISVAQQAADQHRLSGLRGVAVGGLPARKAPLLAGKDEDARRAKGAGQFLQANRSSDSKIEDEHDGASAGDRALRARLN